MILDCCKRIKFIDLILAWFFVLSFDFNLNEPNWETQLDNNRSADTSPSRYELWNGFFTHFAVSRPTKSTSVRAITAFCPAASHDDSCCSFRTTYIRTLMTREISGDRGCQRESNDSCHVVSRVLHHRDPLIRRRPMIFSANGERAGARRQSGDRVGLNEFLPSTNSLTSRIGWVTCRFARLKSSRFSSTVLLSRLDPLPPSSFTKASARISLTRAGEWTRSAPVIVRFNCSPCKLTLAILSAAGSAVSLSRRAVKRRSLRCNGIASRDCDANCVLIRRPRLAVSLLLTSLKSGKYLSELSYRLSRRRKRTRARARSWVRLMTGYKIT